MKSPQQKLIDFLLAKQEWLNNVTKIDPNYINQDDIAEIRGWTTEQAEKARIGILNQTTCVFDKTSCPFCQIYDDCHKCTYGKRHNICSIVRRESPWTKYIFTGKVLERTPIPTRIINLLNN